MLRILQSVMMLALLAFSSPAFGEDPKAQYLPEFMVGNEPLKDDALIKAFSGIKHVGFYRFGREEIPTHKFEETTYSDGRVQHLQGDEELKGRWYVKNDRICFRYADVWMRLLCYDIYRVGTCYYHLIRSSGGVDTFGWTARSTPEGEKPTCDAQIS